MFYFSFLNFKIHKNERKILITLFFLVKCNPKDGTYNRDRETYLCASPLMMLVYYFL